MYISLCLLFLVTLMNNIKLCLRSIVCMVYSSASALFRWPTGKIVFPWLLYHSSLSFGDSIYMAVHMSKTKKVSIANLYEAVIFKGFT